MERAALPERHEAVTRAVLNVERRRRSRDTSNRRSRDTPFAAFVNRTADEQRLRRVGLVHSPHAVRPRWRLHAESPRAEQAAQPVRPANPRPSAPFAHESCDAIAPRSKNALRWTPPGTGGARAGRPRGAKCRLQGSSMKATIYVSLGLAALLMGSTAASAKTLVYCSEGSPENFQPAINTTGTSFDAARPVYNRLTEFKRGTTEVDARPRRKLGYRRRRQDHHLSLAQRRQVPFAEGLQADPRFQRRRRAVLVQSAVEARQPLFQGVGRQIRLFQRHGHARAARYDREEGRLHRRVPSEDAERRHPRQSRDGFRLDRVGRIRRLPVEEGNARAIRSGAGRHRAVLLRRLSEGRRDPFQEEPGLFRREGAGRRSHLRDHARRDRALRQAEGRRMPHQRLSAPGGPRGDGKGPDAEGHQRLRPQHRFLGVQQHEAAARQEGSAPGAEHGDRPRRDHPGRLSRRGRKGQDADPAHDVVL